MNTFPCFIFGRMNLCKHNSFTRRHVADRRKKQIQQRQKEMKIQEISKLQDFEVPKTSPMIAITKTGLKTRTGNEKKKESYKATKPMKYKNATEYLHIFGAGNEKGKYINTGDEMKIHIQPLDPLQHNNIDFEESTIIEKTNKNFSALDLIGKENDENCSDAILKERNVDADNEMERYALNRLDS